MKRRLIILAPTAVMALISIILTVSSPPDADANSDTITYEWYACGDFFSGNPDFDCPNMAIASNGDTILIEGEGTLQVHPKEVDGGGTFIHSDADGNLIGGGTFIATELLSFKTYGGTTEPGFGADFRTGLANIRVELFSGEIKVGDGILRIGCRLPGVKLPPSLFEGVKLNLQGGPNFNKLPDEPTVPGTPPGGPTLFIELP